MFCFYKHHTRKTMRRKFKRLTAFLLSAAMALSLMTGIPFSELGLGITVSAADAATVGAFEVTTDGTNGTDYTYENGVLTGSEIEELIGV